jgi:hypothetical protein
MMYKLLKDVAGLDGVVRPQNTILRVDDNAFIPFDTANTDYQAYLKWLSEGNTPEPAEASE